MANSAVTRPNESTDSIPQPNAPDNLAPRSWVKHGSTCAWVGLFASTIFLGAFLLFQVQPILGKFILPWFGGSPGVWTTCMLVFQFLLFGGYAYAHILSKSLKISHQVLLHIGMLGLAMYMLPITPSSDWKPVGNEAPIGTIILLLVCNVGIPYFLLSSTGPLLQSWLSQSQIIEKPYRLYSLSNVGSMLALLSFPFWFEISYSSHQQASIWSIGFLAYGFLCIAGAVGIWILTEVRGNRPAVANEQPKSSLDSERSTAALPLTDRVQWLTLACIPSLMLLAVTNQVCIDTAVIPFLWIVPLAIYLLSFILTFDSEKWYNRRLCVQLAVVSFLVVIIAKKITPTPTLWIEILFNFSGLFFTCMVCHGQLYASRPAPKHLTSFYLSISFGGALGGLFVGLIAPSIFRGFYEYQVGVLSLLLLFAATYLHYSKTWREAIPARLKWGAGLGIPLFAIISYSIHGAPSNSQHTVRNFYGVLHVITGPDLQREGEMRKLLHGRIVHGSQYLDDERHLLPTTYYTQSSGVGQAIESLNTRPIRVGVVGLGVGTLATYGKGGDTYRFYEIDPDVIQIAQDHFTFLDASKAQTEIVIGDARLALEREEPQQFDLFVLDAFSGDAIPVHLLTREAMDIYRRHLKPDGKIAIHVSNLYFDLKPIVQGLADGQGYACQFQQGAQLASPDAYSSVWALLTPDKEWLANFDAARATSSPRKPVLWRDDRSNLFEALK